MILTTTRILIIADNRILREGITALINERMDSGVVAFSDVLENCLAKARSVKPQAVLMDMGLDGRNSLDIVRTMKKECPGIKVIGMGLVAAQADIMEFVQAGTEGFILKTATMAEMLETVRAVTSGTIVLPASMAGALFSQVAGNAPGLAKRILKGDSRMTEREKEVIALIVDARSNKEIAGELNIATFTVKSHVHNILEKLALNTRLQIAKHAREGMPA